MSEHVVRLAPPDDEGFAAFGRFVTGPDKIGARRFYSDCLQTRPKASAPVLHVNRLTQSALPLTVSGVERHPHAAQCFLPLDVARYAVMVMPSDDAGLPCPERARAYLVPGTMGVVYHPGVWHLGATVLDGPGQFAVLMWRGGPLQDDEFRTIPPLTLTMP